MCVWVYDGSFEGLMSIVYKWFYTKEKPEDIQAADREVPSLLYASQWVDTNPLWAEKAAKGIIERLGEENFRRLSKVYFSETEGLENCIIQFLRLGFKMGPRVIENLADPFVADFYKRESSVARESHKFLGLLRFQELENGWLYAAYEPSYNLLAILSEHFSQRLGSENWIIHDLKRNLASVYANGKWHAGPLEQVDMLHLAEDELLFQNLWKRYYKHIGIEERRNEKLKMQMMPKKYWRYLSELKPEWTV